LKQFIGILATALAKKLPDPKPGLIIDNEYLFDNSGALSVGEIPWRDIEHISVMEIQKQKMLMVEVKNIPGFQGERSISIRNQRVFIQFTIPLPLQKILFP
jgi:hypothetical protein